MILKWYPPQLNNRLGFINPGLTLLPHGVSRLHVENLHSFPRDTIYIHGEWNHIYVSLPEGTLVNDVANGTT